MDPYIQTLAVQLAETAARNTASSIVDRIKTARARKQNNETIAELEDIIHELIEDKTELSRIAQAFEETLVAQRISSDEIQYITNSVIPVFEKIIAASAGANSEGDEQVTQQQEVIDLLKPLISAETITVLQLVGFNFKKAIGEPLTSMLAQSIRSKTPLSPGENVELTRLQAERDIAMIEIAKDPEAWKRLCS